MAWAVVVGAGIGLAGAAYTSHQAGKAADQQAASTDKAMAENARQYDQTRADYTPYREAGTTALGQFARENDTPLDVSHLQMDPGYQFGLTQGQQAIDRKTAAAGGRISGAALKEAAQYGTDYATTGYSAAYGRAKSTRYQIKSRLAALAGIGQTATNSTSAAGQDSTRQGNALTIAAGNNQGAATLAQSNIWGNAGNQIAALYGRKTTGYVPNVDGSGSNPYSGYDAAGNGGWGIE